MTWADGFEEYLDSYEVRLHRRTKTFGGKLWTRPYRTRGLSAETQLEVALRALETTHA